MWVMRLACACASVCAFACNGIAIGESGEEPEQIARCVPEGEAGIADLERPIEGLARTPAELVADAEVELEGTLDLADGPRVPVHLVLAVSGIVRVVSTSGDPKYDCKPYLLADATLDIDAGDTLRGVARGPLYIREPLQFRGEWNPLSDFESNLEPPRFDGEVVNGPALLASVLREDDGHWIGSLQYAAHVELEPCNAKTEMCTGGPGGFTPDYRPLGELEELELVR